MSRRFLIALAATVNVAVCSSSVTAQELLAQTYAQSSPGAYLSWWKLLVVIVLFLCWVKMADWINKDSQKIGELTDLKPEIWNPINVGSMLAGFWCAISIPVFWAGLPVYIVAVFTPFLFYFFLRRAKIKASPGIVARIKAAPNAPNEPAFESLAQDEGERVFFKAAGEGQEAQQNLIRARSNAEAFRAVKTLVVDGFARRADVLVMDYSRDVVKLQTMVDGIWHPLDLMQRQSGDAALVCLKLLAGLDPADRRSRQLGRFSASISSVVDKLGRHYEGDKLDLELLTQGVQSGERVELKFILSRKSSFSLPQLGMWPDMARLLTSRLDKPGLVVIAAPPHQGLSTTWRATMLAADRITRDWVGVIDVNDNESLVENILPNRYNAATGESPATNLSRLLLSQPDALAVPHVVNGKSLDMLCDQVVNHQRTVITQVSAKSAAEAVLRLYNTAEDKQQFVRALTAATCQRLARRLCDTCKQPVTVQPNLIQRLGGDPAKQNTLFNPYVLPPPDKQVDEQGKPIEMLPCDTCAGIGYIGRIAIFEILDGNDRLRKTLLNQPSLDAINQVAQKTGGQLLVSNGYKLALLGITSVSEAQRALKS